MGSLINRFRRDDEGAALVEYGMLVGLIAVICVVAVTTLGTEVSTAFSTIASALSGIRRTAPRDFREFRKRSRR
jgi:pilus assembly protein Flp/PilA